ncbi:MAG: hypothetical protein WCE44_01200 [Candidatus Velthaea sp.]|jgi:hypothetical protein
MTEVRTILRKLAGLFVDDPVVAAGMAVWIALIAVLGIVAPGLALARAVALALGLCVILTLSILRGGTEAP